MTARTRTAPEQDRRVTARTAWTVIRLVAAALIAAAVIAQLSASVGTAISLGRPVGTTIANFFSFFTILSNTSAAIALVVAAIIALRRPDARTEPMGLAVALAAVTTFMLITGVVYNILLRGIELPQGSEPIPWSNEVLHLIGPLFLLADLLLAPARRALPWRALWVVLAVPVAWATYTMIRGPLVVNPATGSPGWYPYPFLNPNGPGGWPSVLVYVAIISAAFVVVGALVVAWSRRRPRG